MAARPVSTLTFSSSETRRLEKILNEIESTGKANLSSIIGGSFNFKPTAVKHAMFMGNKPISESQLVEEVIKGIKSGKIAQELDIYFETLSSLKENDPVRYQAWVDSGYLPTTFAGGANTTLRNELKARNLIPGDTSGAISKYQATIHQFTEANRIYYVPTPMPGSEYKQIFQETIANIPANERHSYQAGGANAAVVFTDSVSGKSIVVTGRTREDPITSEMVFIYGASGKYEPYPDPVPIEEPPKVEHTSSDGMTLAQFAASQLTEVGHTVGENQSQVAQSTLLNIQKLIEFERNNNNRASVIEYLSGIENGLKQVVANLIANDKVYFKVTSKDVITSEAYKRVLEEAHLLGIDEILIVEEIEGGQISFNKISTTMRYSISASSPENVLSNALKGSRGTVFFNQLSNLLKGIALDRSKLVVFEKGSSSIFTQAILRALDKIFNTNEFSKQIVKQAKRTQSFKTKIIPNIQKTNVTDIKKFNNKVEAEIRKNVGELERSFNRTNVRKVSPKRIVSGNIVAALNADLKDYVIAEMVYPSLQNRTGRFAGSARILAQNKDVLQYTYMKSPYSVFSMNEGKAPWATPQRDPARIIDAAIKKSGMDKFGRVFRTEVK